jgi:hypothetical protein
MKLHELPRSSSRATETATTAVSADLDAGYASRQLFRSEETEDLAQTIRITDRCGNGQPDRFGGLREPSHVRVAVQQSSIPEGDGREHSVPVSKGPVRDVGPELAGRAEHAASPAQA